MLRVEGDSGEHEKFRMLCARAISLDLAPLEEYELREHLHECKDCREVLLQYRSLTTEGMLTLLSDAELEAVPNWDESEARRRLLERVFADQRAAQTPNPVPVAVARRTALAWVNEKPLVRMALAACLLFAIGFGGYRLGAHKAMLASGSAASAISRNAAPAAGDARLASLVAGASPTTPAEERWLKLVEEKETAVAALSAQAKQLERMQSENAQKEQELGRLRAELRAIAEQDQQLVAANAQSGARFAALSQQRDTLLAQVQALSQTYDSQKTELASLRSEHDKAILRTSSLESKIEELTAANRDQERKVKDAEQYLTSDRDIRELMGARKLYIADVFDVDGTSRTQKPFGRVFYTQGKSLVFYAFDLDREPGVVNASTFQVWGQREAPQGEQPTPMNLGILYRDSESNRRWVMRFDEPSQLSEIDAVFVTVEPRGGSHKPTSKPFLYALLRNEANHP